jgi:hypothetical protein
VFCTAVKGFWNKDAFMVLPQSVGATTLYDLLATHSQSRDSLKQARKGGGTRLSRDFSNDPPGEIDRTSDQNMFEMGFDQTQVTRSAQVNTAYPQRNRAFNPGSMRILLFERFGRFPFSRRLEGQLLGDGRTVTVRRGGWERVH